MITVVDYGMGNLMSVAKALELSGRKISISSEPREILEADALVLPGVGAFRAGMENLQKLGLAQALIEFAGSGKPFLGICLGMQLMFEASEEGGGAGGLGVFNGTVKRFRPGVKVPHVGWNTVSMDPRCAVFEGIENRAAFYFVHSYYAEPACAGICAATTEYGAGFCSAASKGNVFLVQFHPEKSQANGLKLLSNFCNLTY